MIPIVYDILLLFMLFILYLSGKKIAKTGKIWSKSGVIAIIVYTLNEGLRFGRGVDYNNYWRGYEAMKAGYNDFDFEYGFQTLVNLFISTGLSWQCLVFFISFLQILAFLFLLIKFRSSLPVSLPAIVLISMLDTENMVKYYLAFSFLLIGLSFVIEEKDKKNILIYVIFGSLACLFHVAILPIVVLFYVLKFVKRPMLSPITTIIVFYIICFSFKIEFMQNFVNYVELFSHLSVRFEKYANHADYWLAGGNAGRATSVFPGITEMAFVFMVLILSYQAVKLYDNRYIYVYNLLLIGILLRPFSIQLELLQRYQKPFYFFQAILFGYVVNLIWQKNIIKLKYGQIIRILIFIVSLNMARPFFIDPFRKNEKIYMYVWNKDKETSDQMKYIWGEEFDKHSKKYGAKK